MVLQKIEKFFRDFGDLVCIAVCLVLYVFLAEKAAVLDVIFGVGVLVGFSWAILKRFFDITSLKKLRELLKELKNNHTPLK